MSFPILSLALVAVRVVADEGWSFAFGVDAHPPDLVGVLAVEPLGLGDLELAQHGLQTGIAVENFLLH